MVFNSIFVIQGGIEDIRKNLKIGADRKLRGQQKRMVRSTAHTITGLYRSGLV